MSPKLRYSTHPLPQKSPQLLYPHPRAWATGSPAEPQGSLTGSPGSPKATLPSPGPGGPWERTAGQGMAGGNQTPSHPQHNLPLTYPLPTITFLTLEERS